MSPPSGLWFNLSQITNVYVCVCFSLLFLLPEVSLHAILLDHIHAPIVKSPYMREEKKGNLIKSNDISMQYTINKVFIKLWR